MRKVRLVSIVLGVLILAGMMMSGAALAQVSEEPVQNIQSIAFEEFFKSPESFVGKKVELTEGTVVTLLRTGPPQGPRREEELTISVHKEMFLEFNNGPFVAVFPPSLPVPLEESKYNPEIGIKVGDIIKVKGVIQRVSREEIEKIKKKYSDERNISSVEKTKVKAFTRVIYAMLVAGQIGLKENIIEEAYYISSSEIEITGHVVDLPKSEETLQKETLEIPDYENFRSQILQAPLIDKDGDGNPDLFLSQYIRKIIPEERLDQERLTTTLKDLIYVIETPPKGEELLIWLPETPGTVNLITGVMKKADIEPGFIESIARYAMKENGEWKFIDEETFHKRKKEILKSIGFTDEEIEALEEKADEETKDSSQ